MEAVHQATPPGDGNNKPQMESISQGDTPQEVRSSCDQRQNEDSAGITSSPKTPPAKNGDNMCNSTSGALPGGKNHRALSLQDEQLLKASLRAAVVGNSCEKSSSSAGKTGLSEGGNDALDELEEIFEPRPSTSNSPSRKDLAGKRSMSLAVDPSDRRQRLLLLPRTSQYEPHPLLQERSLSGLTELESLLMEKEESASHSGASTSFPRQPLVPRQAYHSTHPLLEKKTSGISELEQLLIEKEQQLKREDEHHSKGIIYRKDSLEKVRQERRRSSVLQPRINQYEASALLESRDETGLSPIDQLLKAKNEEMDKGKCSVKCTCKNVNCPNCKGSSGASSPRSPSQEVEGDTEMRIEPKTQPSKHVHFCKDNSNAEPAHVVGEMKNYVATEEEQKNNREKFSKRGSGKKKGRKQSQDQQKQQQDTGASINDNKQKCKDVRRKQTCSIS